MTAIEDRLQELRYTVGLPSLPDVDELAARATGRRRRRRRHRLVAAGTVTVALLVPAVLVARQGDDPDTRVGTESPGQPSPAATTPLPASGIPIVLFGTNPWDGSIIVSDLDAGVRATYADGEHSVDFKTPEDFEADASAGDGSARFGNMSAALTADGELIAGVMACAPRRLRSGPVPERARTAARRHRRLARLPADRERRRPVDHHRGRRPGADRPGDG